MQVVDAPEILTVIESVPHLSTFLNALYECRYDDFFRVRGLPSCILLLPQVLALHAFAMQPISHEVVQEACFPATTNRGPPSARGEVLLRLCMGVASVPCSALSGRKKALW